MNRENRRSVSYCRKHSALDEIRQRKECQTATAARTRLRARFTNRKAYPDRMKLAYLQRELKAQGVKFENEADESTTGPASFTVIDPDGNPILIDQHV